MEDPSCENQPEVFEEEEPQTFDDQNFNEPDINEINNHDQMQNDRFNPDFIRGNFPYMGPRPMRFRRGRPPFFRPEFAGPRMNGFPSRGMLPRPYPPHMRPPYRQNFDNPQDELQDQDEEGQEEGRPQMFPRGQQMYGNRMMNQGWHGDPQLSSQRPMFRPRFDPTRMDGSMPAQRMMQQHPFNQPPPHMMDPNAPLPLIPPPSGMPPSALPFRPPPGMPPPPFMQGHLSNGLRAQSSQDIWVENVSSDGKPYYYSMQTRETRWERPEGVKVIKQTELSLNKNSPNTTTLNLDVAPSNEPPKPPEVLAWTEYKTAEGTPYYHNASTSTTVWEKPKVLADWEVFISTINGKPPVANNKPIPAQPVKIAPPVRPVVAMNFNHNPPAPTALSMERPKQPPVEPKPKEDQSKPVSSTPVSGTPWCVVWTGDKKVFFFNPSQRLSVWKKPEELKGREDVDRLLEKCPDEVPDEPPAEKKIRMDESQEPCNEMDIDMSKNNNNNNTAPAPFQSPPPGHPTMAKDLLKEAVEKARIDQSTLPVEQRIEQFKEMLSEKQVSAFSTWEKELHKVVFDSRYLLLNSKERKQVFETYMKERAEEERKEMKNKLKRIKESFRELLKEAEITSKTSFSEFVSKWNKDDRYREVEKTRDRENMFQEYVDELKKKEREKRSKEKGKIKSDFFDLLKENKIKRNAVWSDVKKKLSSSSRYKNIESSTRREELFNEYISKLESSDSSQTKNSADETSGNKKEKDRREREQASLREREKEVKEALGNSLREREKERDQHMKVEAESNFKELLTISIKDASLDWRDAKKILKKSSKWEISEALESTTMEKLFSDHISFLLTKLKASFQKLLDEEKAVTLSMTWKQVKKLIRNDARYEKLSKTSHRPELEFNKWHTEKVETAKKEFMQLLHETPAISFKLKKMEVNSETRDEIFEGLQDDKRFQALDKMDEVKEDLLLDFAKSLENANAKQDNNL